VTGFVVGEDLAGERLDVALAAHLEVSRSRAVADIEAGVVTIDDEPATKRHRLRVGQRVEVAERPTAALPPAPPAPPIRYQDEHLAVIAKPAGLVVHPGPGHHGGTLIEALRAAGVPLAAAGGEGRPGIVHRLDRDTSGLMVVASTDQAHAGLSAALQERRDISRRYLALVLGVPAAERGRIEAPIGRDPRDRKRFAVVHGGKPAVTRYRVLAQGEAPRELVGAEAPVSLLGCTLETGRTHQIRVHLTTLGHAIVGDPTYGRRADVARALGLDRPFLHAAALSFVHPVTGESIHLDEPLPPALRAALTLAGLDDPGALGPEATPAEA
jgi:23S rRNA pseudouridine1911/1915/1917 synthase